MSIKSENTRLLPRRPLFVSHVKPKVDFMLFYVTLIRNIIKSAKGGCLFIYVISLHCYVMLRCSVYCVVMLYVTM